MVIESIWRIVDSHWKCVSADFIDGKDVRPVDHFDFSALADYLFHLGFDIPAEITYCLAENSEYFLKFRHVGNKIHLFVEPKKNKCYV